MADILGISAFYHDSAACLIRDGAILAAAQEERFTRKKHDPGFPSQAIQYCLREAQCAITDLRYIVFYDKPLVKFERLLETYLSFAPRGRRSFIAAMPVWLKEKLFLKTMLSKALAALADVKKSALPPLLFTEHHEAHAASAFFPSPFRTAAVLCMDGVGEWATTSAWLGHETPAHAVVGHPLSPFARAALLGVYLLHRLQGQFRGVQSDGARAVWAAEVCADDLRPFARPQAGRNVPAQHGLF